MDANFYIQNAGIGFFILLVGVLVIDFTIIHLVAKAAKMKNRSYKAFFWLSFIFRPMTLALIVAALPFNPYDPRSPYVDMSPDEALPERFINPHSEQKLATVETSILLGLGSAFLILGTIMSITSILSAISNQMMYN